MSRQVVAALDVGTNTAQLVVARVRPEDEGDGGYEVLLERAEITRLGQGVDATGRLSEAGMARAVEAIATFVEDARRLGARLKDVAACATSATRDATNGDALVRRVREACGGLELEIISGEEEARLSFLAVQGDFGAASAHAPLVAIDVGGGSTEVVVGPSHGPARFRHSAQVGSVRLTERCFPAEVAQTTRGAIPSDVQVNMRQRARAAFSEGGVTPAVPGAQVIALAATATSLLAVHEGLESTADPRVHGGELTLDAIRATVTRLAELTLAARQQVRGLDPKRAEVICAGGIVLEAALEALGVTACRVSDRGLRWGLLRDRFGRGASRVRT